MGLRRPKAARGGSDERKPWERLEAEGDKHWRAFEAFLLLGPTRSIAEAARVVGYRSRSTARRYATRFDWIARARAWDAEHSAKAFKLAQEAYRKQIAEQYFAQIRVRGAYLASLDKAADALVDLVEARDIRAIQELHKRAGLDEKIEAPPLPTGASAAQGVESLLCEIAEEISPGAAREVLEALRRRRERDEGEESRKPRPQANLRDSSVAQKDDDDGD